MLRRMNTWWRRSMVCLRCKSVRRVPPGEEWSRRETVEARGTKWNVDVEMDTGIPGPPLDSPRDERTPNATATETTTAPESPPQPDKLRCVDKECTQKHSGSELSGLKSSEFSWMPGMRDSRSEKVKIPGTKVDEQQRRRRRNAELLRIHIHDHWTRVQVRWILSRRGRNDHRGRH